LHILIETLRIDHMAITDSANQQIRAPLAADWALSRGISALTTAEVANMLGSPASQVSQRLASAIRRTEWVTPARGLWVPVPPEYRGWGGPPATEFIDALMRHLGATYYLGWLSAAALFGATHQAPQVAQVAASHLVRNREVGRVRLQFHTRTNAGTFPTTSHLAKSGPVQVSTPEVTALDLAADLIVGGGLDNVATVVVELADQAGLEVSKVTALASHFPPAVGRRLGWILEEFTQIDGLDELQRAVTSATPTPSLLDSLSPARGRRSERWNVRINTAVEIEA
jgi:predicted transcriptional regulator of viral defense system